MRFTLTLILLLGLVFLNARGQPVTNTNPIVTLDFDANGTGELFYTFASQKRGSVPETWTVIYGVNPGAETRILKANGQRVNFLLGETIDSLKVPLTNYITINPGPPTLTYGIELLYYRAVQELDWRYSTVVTAFESEVDLFLALKLKFATGTHFGWIHLGRPTADPHTEFEIKGFTFHPVPNAPIKAGQLPPLPPLQTQVDPQGLTFTWDARWGPLILESSTNLVPPISWEVVGEHSGGPLQVSTGDEQQFYRLRVP